MVETKKSKNRFGLLGKNISYSFSRGYFANKFEVLGLQDHSYENFDIEAITQLPDILDKNQLRGLNVTIPYKEEVIPYLDSITEDAKKIGAVNTIQFTPKGLIGHNTDAYGFKRSIEPLLNSSHKKALILGTGGASKAVVFVFEKLGISYQYVSRSPSENILGYNQLTKEVLQHVQIIVNCSPVGTFPKVLDKPNLPYEYLNKTHVLFDLIYNPAETAFLKEGKKRQAQIQNGLPMLEFQAEKAWEIWNSAV